MVCFVDCFFFFNFKKSIIFIHAISVPCSVGTPLLFFQWSCSIPLNTFFEVSYWKVAFSQLISVAAVSMVVNLVAVVL